MRAIPNVGGRRYPRVALLCVGGALLAGCGMFGGRSSEQPMTSSSPNQAGQGTVEATAGENGNTDLAVRVKHLAAPARLASDASVYVVWIKPRAAQIQNVGALEVDDDLVGALDTTTPHLAFTVTVTPEPSARMAAPTHSPVFTAEVDRGE